MSKLKEIAKMMCGGVAKYSDGGEVDDYGYPKDSKKDKPLYDVSGYDKKAKGGVIPGEAIVDGDSEKNDVVKAKLSPGEGVIPRSHMKDEESAHQFVTEMFKRHAKKKKA